MPLQDHMQPISVDDHIIEPPHVWQDRLPERCKEAGPRVVEVDDDLATRIRERLVKAGQADMAEALGQVGSEVWMFEGRPHPQIGLNAVAGRDASDYGFEPTRYEDMRPGCYDPVARLADMDTDGVHAQLCFPTFPRFAGTGFLAAKDKELALACVQAYNDWHLEEWCAADPERFIPMVILPLWDIDAAVAEVERTAARGARAVSFPEATTPLRLPSIHTGHWDPLFAAVQAASMPLCMHFGTSGNVPQVSPDAPDPSTFVLMGCNSMTTVVDFVFSPVLRRFPGLQIALSEGGIGWLPYITERADAVWETHKDWNDALDASEEARPSLLMRKHFSGCFISDDFGVEVRHAIGVDRIMWEGDYPHSDSMWPKSRAYLEGVFADVPDDETHRIVELNARELFSFPAAGAPRA